MFKIEINPEWLDTALQLRILEELAQNEGAKTLISNLSATRKIDTHIELHNLCFLAGNGYVHMDRLHNIGSNMDLRNDIFLLITSDGKDFLQRHEHK